VLPLRFVALDQVVPHEATDARRSALLAESIQDEQIMRNPPIVAAVGDRYVVLDGATRTDALRSLGVQHVVVQDVPVDDNLGLETWHHVVRSIDAQSLRQAISNVAGVSLNECEPEEARDKVIESGGLCSISFFGGPALVASSDGGANRFDALAAISSAYTAAAVVSRTLERDLSKSRRGIRTVWRWSNTRTSPSNRSSSPPVRAACCLPV
jgi:hypothetical protein